MRGHRDPAVRLLRWYPPAWRERYGEELVSLMHDDLSGRRPALAYRWNVAAAGLRQRARQAGVIGRGADAADRRRTGSLIVLASWWAMVLAGASYAKASEHFGAAVPLAQRAGPQGAYDVVLALAAVGALIVVTGAVAALPTSARFVRGGGWPTIRGHVRRTLALSALTLATTAALSVWAHHLASPQRNGGDPLYAAAFVTWALLVAATLAQWTATAVAAARCAPFSERLVLFESRLALALSVVMAGVAASIVLWWSWMARAAPWFLRGAPAGSSGSVVTLNLAVTVGLAAVALVGSGFGAARVLGARGSVNGHLTVR